MMPNKVTATTAVRNFARLVDQVRFTHHAISIYRGDEVIAELVPPPRSGFPVSELKAFLSQLPNLGADTRAFSKTLQTIRASAKLPADPWD